MKPPLTRQENLAYVAMSETEVEAGPASGGDAASERVLVHLPTGVRLTFPASMTRLMVDRVFGRMAATGAEPQHPQGSGRDAAPAGARREEVSFTEALDETSRSAGRRSPSAEQPVEPREEVRRSLTETFVAEAHMAGRSHATAPHSASDHEPHTHAAAAPLAERREELLRESLTGTVEGEDTAAHSARPVPPHVPGHEHRPHRPEAAFERREEVFTDSVTETFAGERASGRSPPSFPGSVPGGEPPPHGFREHRGGD